MKHLLSQWNMSQFAMQWHREHVNVIIRHSDGKVNSLTTEYSIVMTARSIIISQFSTLVIKWSTVMMLYTTTMATGSTVVIQ